MVAGVPRLSLVQQPGVEEEGQRRAVVREQHQVAAAAVGEVGAHLADRGEIGASRTGSIGTDYVWGRARTSSSGGTQFHACPSCRKAHVGTVVPRLPGPLLPALSRASATHAEGRSAVWSRSRHSGPRGQQPKRACQPHGRGRSAVPYSASRCA